MDYTFETDGRAKIVFDLNRPNYSQFKNVQFKNIDGKKTER